MPWTIVIGVYSHQSQRTGLALELLRNGAGLKVPGVQNFALSSQIGSTCETWKVAHCAPRFPESWAMPMRSPLVLGLERQLFLNRFLSRSTEGGWAIHLRQMHPLRASCASGLPSPKLTNHPNHQSPPESPLQRSHVECGLELLVLRAGACARPLLTN